MGTKWRGVAIAAAAISLLAAGCGDDEKTGTGDTSGSSTTAGGVATTSSAGEHGDGGEHGGDSGTTSAASPCGTFSGTIELDAAQDSDGTKVVVKNYSLKGGNGHLVIHLDSGGSLGAAIGHVGIKEGSGVAMEVPFDEAQESGTYWVMLHTDDGDDVYEFGPGTPDNEPCDGAVLDGEAPVMGQSKVTVK